MKKLFLGVYIHILIPKGDLYVNQHIIQDIRQIRSICQQLAQNERQNAQVLSQQAGMQNMAQRETYASQQLQQCVNLCDRIEQSMTTQQGITGAYANYVPTATGISHFPALNQVMQADRQQQQQQPAYGAGYGAAYGGGFSSGALNQVMQADRQQQPQQPAYGAGYGAAYGGGFSSGAINQVMQADRQQQPAYGAGYGAAYGGGFSSGAINPVMQADRQARSNEGPSYTNYNQQQMQ